jgi:carbamoyltransferase
MVIKKRILIGMNVGHDASITLTDSEGKVLYSASEERFSRSKNHLGAPYSAFEDAIETCSLSRADFDNCEVFISGNRWFNPDFYWLTHLLTEKEFQGRFDIFNEDLPPGLQSKLMRHGKISGMDSKKNFERNIVGNLKIVPNRFTYINHHDAHAASAFYPSGQQTSFCVTMDGSGDGESATISIMNRDGTKRVLQRISEKYSLGYLYSEATKRYGFRESKHEGKITGLAALGRSESAIERLMNDFRVKSGKFRYANRFLIDPRNYYFPPSLNSRSVLKKIILRAEQQTENFSELAGSVQIALEEITIKWLAHFGKELEKADGISLAGGVFSNVALNRRIRELSFDKEVYVFPNMGDGGLSAGVIWEGMRLKGHSFAQTLLEDMYLGPSPEPLSHDGSLVSRRIYAQELAKRLMNGEIIGVVYGRMEFGPRALCHRSILATPIDANINQTLNKRLNRTEFMPFAPVVRDVDFKTIFETNMPERHVSDQSSNFRFMTETCAVKSSWKKLIPAVVHVDGTARPQILIESDNPFVYQVLEVMARDHGIPVLINTSFNAHEEPILKSHKSAIEQLKAGRVDSLLVDGNLLIERKTSRV